MLLTRFDPFKDFANMQRVLNNYVPANDDISISSFAPKVNTREGEFAYHIELDLPGIKKEDVRIDLDDNKLTITGERKLKEGIKEEEYYKVETSFGKFQRIFSLPENVDVENINAVSSDGILEITIPKLEKNKNTKQIEIK